MHRTRLCIDGTFTPPEGCAYFPAIDPASETTIAEVAAAQAADVERAVRAVRRAFDSQSWSGLNGAVRASFLRRIANGIRERLNDIALAEVRDNGKPLAEAQWDVGDATLCFDYYANLAAKDDARQEGVDVGDPRFQYSIAREPAGVVAAITPWNFPLLIAAWKVAPALAAGCTVVLKPSELCSLSCEMLAEIIHAAELPAGVFNLVTGTGAQAGEPLANHGLVDKVAFTRSLVTGRKVMQAASAGIRRVSLELGGKSPFIIFDDCDIEKAVEWSLFRIFWNKGEVCSATSRIRAKRGIFARFVERLATAAEAISIGPGEMPGVKLGPLVSKNQYDKMLSVIATGKETGARLVTGGDRPEFRPRLFSAPNDFRRRPDRRDDLA